MDIQLKDDKTYFIISNKAKAACFWYFWRSNGCGYTQNLNEAGLFKATDYFEYPIYDGSNKKECLDSDNFLIDALKVKDFGRTYLCVTR